MLFYDFKCFVNIFIDCVCFKYHQAECTRSSTATAQREQWHQKKKKENTARKTATKTKADHNTNTNGMFVLFALVSPI